MKGDAGLDEEDDEKKVNYRLEIYGNDTTFKGRIRVAIVTGVKNSPYFKQLYQLKTFNEVVDEIYNEVSYIEPWVAGKGLGHPSSAFCLLYKMFLMRLSLKQMKVLLNHQDSPYIRALGFLYLRYGLNPREFWSWFKDYVNDEEEIVPRSNPGGSSITIGRLVRDLMRNTKFYDTMLPRVPATVMQELEKNLRETSKDNDRSEPKRKRSRSPARGRNDYSDRRPRRISRSYSPGRRDAKNWRTSRDRDRYSGRSRHYRRSRRSRSRSAHSTRHGRDRRHHRSRSPSPLRKKISPSRSRSSSPRTPSPEARARAEKFEAVRAKYSSTHGPVNIGGSYGRSGTTGIVEKDVVLKSQVPKAVLEYQRRNAR